MKRDSLLLLVVVSFVAIISTIVAYVLFSPSSPEHVSIEYTFSVQSEIGFVLDSDALHFGGGPPGARLQRGLNISSTRDARVVLSWDGPGDIVVSKNNFLIQADTQEYVLFFLTVPSDLENGFYEGSIFVTLYEGDDLNE